jgi:hypothetical protein
VVPACSDAGSKAGYRAGTDGKSEALPLGLKRRKGREKKTQQRECVPDDFNDVKKLYTFHPSIN